MALVFVFRRIVKIARFVSAIPFFTPSLTPSQRFPFPGAIRGYFTLAKSVETPLEGKINLFFQKNFSSNHEALPIIFMSILNKL
jgi:hypothetical protein